GRVERVNLVVVGAVHVAGAGVRCAGGVEAVQDVLVVAVDNRGAGGPAGTDPLVIGAKKLRPPGVLANPHRVRQAIGDFGESLQLIDPHHAVGGHVRARVD